MKKSIIRLTSVIAIICLMVSMMPVAFADENAEGTKSNGHGGVFETFNSETNIGNIDGGSVLAEYDGRSSVIEVGAGKTFYAYAEETHECEANIISFDVKSDKSDGIWAYFELFDPIINEKETYSERFKRTVFLNNGYVQYFRTILSSTSDSSLTYPKFEKDIWCHIDICIDYVNKKIFYYLDGELLGKVALTDDYVSCGGFRLVNENRAGAVCYFDNITMYDLEKKGVPLDFTGNVSFPSDFDKYVTLENDKLGSIFFTKDISYNMTVRNTYNKEVDYDITLTVTDGNGILEDTINFNEILAAGEDRVIPVKATVKSYGFHKIKTKATNSETSKVITTENAFSVAMKNDTHNMKMGVNDHTGVGHGIDETERKVKLFSDAGFFGMRNANRWSFIEKTPNVFAFPEDDNRVFAAMDENNMTRYMLLFSSNPVRTEELTPVSSEAISMWADYAAWVAKETKDKKAVYQIWNEYNHDPFNPGKGTVSDYVNLLKASYTKIKSVNPDAKVYGMGGVTFITNLYDWVEEFFKLGGQNYCDGLTFHPYTPTKKAEDSYEVFTKVKEIIKKYGCEDMPISLSEIGFTQSDELGMYQAARMARFSVMAYDEVENIMWYVNQMKNNANDAENNFGMIRAWLEKFADPYETYSARESFLSQAFLNKIMNGAKNKAVIESSDQNVKIHKYKAADGDNLFIIWTVDETDKDITLNIKTDKATVYDMYGNASEYALIDNKLPISIGMAPTYIKGKFTDISVSETNLVNVSTSEIETVTDDTIYLNINKNFDDEASIVVETPENIKVVENNGFVGNRASVLLETGSDSSEKTSVVLKVVSGENVIMKFILPVKYNDTVSLKMLPSYFRSGKWRYNIAVKNNRRVGSASGRIEIEEPAGLNEKLKNIEFKDVPAGSTKNIYVYVPEGIKDVKTAFKAKGILSNGEVYELDSDMYFSSIVYAENKPVIDGVMNDGEWEEFAPYKLKYPSQVKSMTDWTGVEDSGGNVYCMYDDDYFYISARITDNVLGDNDEQKRVWANDSIQFAFTPERTKAAIRTEYGIGIVNGEAAMERYSFVTVDTGVLGMNDKNDFSAIEYEINYDEKTHIATYEAKFPWAQILGPDFKVGGRDSLYFSLLLNDNDGNGRRGWIEYCPGIGGAKDTTLFIETPLVKRGKVRSMN